MNISRRALLLAPAVPLVAGGLLSQAQAQCSGVNMTINGSSGAVSVMAGTPMEIAVFNGPATPTDFVGISLAEAPDDSFQTWNYLNGTRTAPSAGLRFANFTMTAPADMWIYEARLYFQGSFTTLVRLPFVVRTS